MASHAWVYCRYSKLQIRGSERSPVFSVLNVWSMKCCWTLLRAVWVFLTEQSKHQHRRISSYKSVWATKGQILGCIDVGRKAVFFFWLFSWLNGDISFGLAIFSQNGFHISYLLVDECKVQFSDHVIPTSNGGHLVIFVCIRQKRWILHFWSTALRQQTRG